MLRPLTRLLSATLVLLPALANAQTAPSRPVVSPIPYDGPDFAAPGLFPYLIRWDAPGGDASAQAEALFPGTNVSAAPLDLDQDGQAELLVRFGDQCDPGSLDSDSPVCAHVILAYDGNTFVTVLSRLAARVFEVRDTNGAVGVAFDGAAFGVEGLSASLLSPSIAKWGHPGDPVLLDRARKALLAGDKVKPEDILVSPISLGGFHPVYLIAREQAPFFHWAIADRDLEVVTRGVSETLPDAITVSPGEVELVSVSKGQFKTSRITLPSSSLVNLF